MYFSFFLFVFIYRLDGAKLNCFPQREFIKYLTDMSNPFIYRQKCGDFAKCVIQRIIIVQTH